MCDVTFYLLGLIIWPFPAVALLGCIAGCGVQALTVYVPLLAVVPAACCLPDLLMRFVYCFGAGCSV